MRTFGKNLFALLIGVIASLLVLEIFLRIYNPIETRIRGGDIVLPTNRHYRIKNNSIDKLDPVINHNKNSLGFRGEEPPFDAAQDKPEDWKNYLSIVTVGGSTTEGYYLSDNQTWPALLGQKLKKDFPNVWINNAGLDGHSTFGHKLLLEKYLVKLKPKIILFLVGINDVGRKDLNYGVDDSVLKTVYVSSLDFLAKKSELINFILNIWRSIKARDIGVAHSNINLKDLATLDLVEDFVSSKLKEQEKYVDAYGKRLLDLIEISKRNGIEPILITQPILWGEGVDLMTGVDLSSVKVDKEKNGQLYWALLELYNERTRLLGKEEGVLVVDLAKKMPKDSVYYYDGIHFSKKGAQKVAEIIYDDLLSHLQKYGSY